MCGNPSDDSKTDYYQGQDVVNTCLNMTYRNDDDGDVDKNDETQGKGRDAAIEVSSSWNFEFRVLMISFAYLMELSLSGDEAMAENDVCK